MKNTDIRELNVEQLDMINGGYLYFTTINYVDLYQVLDDDGDVRKEFIEKEDAIAYAEAHGYSTEVLFFWEDVQKLRIRGPKIAMPGFKYLTIEEMVDSLLPYIQ